jgi:hypothetical protein
MPHVQAAGHVRRRDHDAVGRAVAAGGEPAILLPALVDTLLDVFGAVGFVAAAASMLLWGNGGFEMPFNASIVLLNWYPMLTLPLVTS